MKPASQQRKARSAVCACLPRLDWLAGCGRRPRGSDEMRPRPWRPPSCTGPRGRGSGRASSEFRSPIRHGRGDGAVLCAAVRSGGVSECEPVRLFMLLVGFRPAAPNKPPTQPIQHPAMRGLWYTRHPWSGCRWVECGTSVIPAGSQHGNVGRVE